MGNFIKYLKSYKCIKYDNLYFKKLVNIGDKLEKKGIFIDIDISIFENNKLQKINIFKFNREGNYIVKMNENFKELEGNYNSQKNIIKKIMLLNIGSPDIITLYESKDKKIYIYKCSKCFTYGSQDMSIKINLNNLYALNVYFDGTNTCKNCGYYINENNSKWVNVKPSFETYKVYLNREVKYKQEIEIGQIQFIKN